MLPTNTPITQTHWPKPKLETMAHGSTRLIPLGLHHCDDLWQLVCAHPDSFAYLRYGPFANKADLAAFLGDLTTRVDQPFWVVCDKDNTPTGWLSICDIDQANGSIEIGSIWFSPDLQGTRSARCALFIAMCHCMDDLGYERLVWRCQADNTKSCRAAEKLGFIFEGTWRNAAVTNGWQRGVS